MDQVKLAAEIAGIALGCAMLVVSFIVYLRKQVFGVGGSVLTTFGFLLLGLSIWSSVELSVGAIKVSTKVLTTQIYQTVNNATKDAAKQAISDAQQGVINHQEGIITSSPSKKRNSLEGSLPYKGGRKLSLPQVLLPT